MTVPESITEAELADFPWRRKTDEWLALRASVKQLEAAEHPDLIDGAGRHWAWWKRDLYRHAASEACAGVCKGGADHRVYAWSRQLLPGPVSIAGQEGL